MDRMQLKALAKINLGLDVLRRREDGYHEVRMIMQTVHIFDQLQLEKRQDTGISVRTKLTICLRMRIIWFTRRRSFFGMNLGFREGFRFS